MSEENVFDLLNDSEIEDLSSDEDEDQYIPHKVPQRVRVGTDYPHFDEPSLIEVEECVEEEEAHIDITTKNLIRWSRSTFLPPDFENWEETYNDVDNEELLSPLNYFYRYLPEHFFMETSTFTNLYANQKGFSNFKPCDGSEIKKLFALHIAAGCLKYPRMGMYWNNALHLDLFQNTMTRDRFFQLRSNLHLVNVLDHALDTSDRIWKVRKIYNLFRERCSLLTLEESVCIDEQIIPFRGQISIKQYVKGKPNPWGIKVFVLSGKSGLCYDFLLYQGDGTVFENGNKQKFGLAAAVVLELSKRLEQSKGHQLFYDNWFSSYNALQVLKQKGIAAAGTIRVGRFKKPDLLSDKVFCKKDRGYCEETVSEDGDVIVTKWLDNRPVVMASNFVGIGEKDQVKRWAKSSKKYVLVERPEVVRRYNQGMCGVDLLDQLISLYRIYVRSRKWTLRLIFHAVDLAAVNSWLEYRRDASRLGIPNKKILDLLHFKLRISNGLIKVGNPVNGTKRGRPSNSPSPVSRRFKPNNYEVCPVSEIRFDTVGHMPLHNGKTQSGRCKNPGCTTGRSHFVCSKCEVHLCLNKDRNCFLKFHQK